MKHKNLNLLVFAVPLSTLAACSSGSDNTPPPPPPVTTVAQEDTFGVAFGTAFRADPNATPIEPKDGDIIPLSLTTEPNDVK